MNRCPAALIGANAYFPKKIRASAQQTRNKVTVVLGTSHFLKKDSQRLENFTLTELDEREGIILKLLKHNAYASWYKPCCVKYNSNRLKRL